MKVFFSSIIIFFASLALVAQSLDDLSFGTDTTFEVVTWNIEWFPKNDQTTETYVTDIIEAIDADIFAIQEIDDRQALQNVIDNLPAYEGNYESTYFAGLAYIYKADVVQINSIYEIYTTSEYWIPFPRSPMVIELSFKGVDFIIINNHYKCCGDGDLDLNNPNDEEMRRFTANNLIKDYIDINFPNDRVIVLGDLNDVLTDLPLDNVFQSFINDPSNYLFTDMDIALGNAADWSYPSWPSHLDHILITNELYEDYANADSSIEVLKIDDYLPGGWSEYDSNVSDHRPVGLKLASEDFVLETVSIEDKPVHFTNYPNPASTETRFYFNGTRNISGIEVTSITGQLIKSIAIPQGQTYTDWDTTTIHNGIYFATLQINGANHSAIKVLVSR